MTPAQLSHDLDLIIGILAGIWTLLVFILLAVLSK